MMRCMDEEEESDCSSSNNECDMGGCFEDSDDEEWDDDDSIEEIDCKINGRSSANRVSVSAEVYGNFD